MESEKDVEKYLKDEIEKLGGIAYKFVSPGRASVPDRLCILPGLVVFVECKSEGEKPTPKQHRELTRLGKLLMNVFVVDRKAAVDELMERLGQYVNNSGPASVPEKGGG